MYLRGPSELIDAPVVETILSVLLEKLVFKPGPDIFWAMNFLQSPVVNGTSSMDQQKLPLKVSCVEGMYA